MKPASAAQTTAPSAPKPLSVATDNAARDITPHDPSLYKAQHIDEGYLKSELTLEQFKQIAEERGYVAIRDFFPVEAIDAARDALVDLVMGRNKDFAHSQHLMVERSGVDLWEDLPLEKREDVVRRLAQFIQYDQRLSSLAEDAELMRYVSTLLGGAEPVLYQHMALIKPPRIGREKPWHQDHAYFPVPLDVPMLGCWIALDPATVDNGCMHVLPGGHTLGPIEHHRVRDWQICDHLMIDRPGCTAVPLPPGGVLFFSSLTPHGTPTNFSDQRRRAVQYHYAPKDYPKLEPQEHKAMFGDIAGDVPC